MAQGRCPPQNGRAVTPVPWVTAPSYRLELATCRVDCAIHRRGFEGVGRVGTSGHHPADGVLAPNEPVQTDADGAPAIVLGRWTLTPRARYDITARILGREDYRFDPIADLAPLDLALGWGPMSDNRVLKAFKVSQGARFYSWRPVTESLPIEMGEVTRSSANTHVIPANAAVAAKLDRLRRGDRWFT